MNILKNGLPATYTNNACCVNGKKAFKNKPGELHFLFCIYNYHIYMLYLNT